MSSQVETRKRLKDVFQTQKLTALATQEPEHPYLSLMAVAMAENINYLIIVTKRETREYFNMVKTSGVAFRIDNRSDGGGHFKIFWR